MAMGVKQYHLSRLKGMDRMVLLWRGNVTISLWKYEIRSVGGRRGQATTGRAAVMGKILIGEEHQAGFEAADSPLSR
jgi:hypothetical protein